MAAAPINPSNQSSFLISPNFPIRQKENNEVLDFDSFEMTKFLTPKQRSSLTNSLRNISDLALKNFVEALNNNEFTPKAKKNINLRTLFMESYEDIYQNLPHLALKARLRNLVVDEQLGSLCLLCQAIDQLIVNRQLVCEDPRFFKISVNDGSKLYEIDPLPRNRVPDEFRIFHLADKSDLKETEELLNIFFDIPLNIRDFWRNIDHWPESEKYFGVFKLPVEDPISWSRLYSEICRVSTICKFPVFLPLQHRDWKQKVLLIPSFSMLQRYYNFRYPSSAMKLRLFIGRCTMKTIEHYKINGARVIQVGMSGANVPNYADGNFGGRLIFTIHDFYHAQRDAVVPKNQQRALLHINELFKKILEKQPQNKQLKHIKWKLLDGELQTDGLFGSLFFIVKTWTEETKKWVIEDMVRNQKTWGKKFNLSMKDLLPPEQEIYRFIQDGGGNGSNSSSNSNSSSADLLISNPSNSSGASHFSSSSTSPFPLTINLPIVSKNLGQKRKKLEDAEEKQPKFQKVENYPSSSFWE